MVFKKALGFLTKIPVIVLLFIAVNLILTFTVTNAIQDNMLEVMYAIQSIPPNSIAIGSFPGTIYAQASDYINAVAGLSLITVIINAFFTGLFVTAVSYEGAKLSAIFKKTFARFGGLLLATFLIMFVMLIAASFMWLLLIVSTTFFTKGLLSVIVLTTVLLFLVALLVSISVKLFLVYPFLIFEDLPAGKALAESSQFSRKDFLGILTTLVFIFIIFAVLTSISDYLLDFITDDTTFTILNTTISALFTSYFLLIPAVYYTEHKKNGLGVLTKKRKTKPKRKRLK